MNFKKWTVVCLATYVLAAFMFTASLAPDNRNHTLEKPHQIEAI
ncbi:phosphatase [Bacillus sp. NPDC077027]